MIDISHWEIGKLELKPGQIIIVRYSPPKFPAPGGTQVADNSLTNKYLQAAKEAFGSALEQVGLKDRVPILLMTDDFDINVICPLEFMDICVRAKEEEGRSSGEV